MPVDPHAFVIAERRLSRAEVTARLLTWTIRFEVPMHPGMSHGAHLFRVYSGLDVKVARGTGPDSIRVDATGTAAELRRLLEWTDELYRGQGVNLRQAFAGERFMEDPIEPLGREIA